MRTSLNWQNYTEIFFNIFSPKNNGCWHPSTGDGTDFRYCQAYWSKKGVHVKEDVIRDICVSKGKQVGTTLKLKQ